MKANELRIGNSIFGNVDSIDGKKTEQFVGNVNYIDYHANGRAVVIGIKGAGRGLSSPDINNFEPIPLTEEWLIKLGFGLWQHNIQYKYRKDGFPFLLRISKDGCVVDGCEFCMKIYHVHQLQNLFFALTGKELQILDQQEATKNNS